MDEFVDRFVSTRVVGYADRLGSWEDHTFECGCDLREREAGLTDFVRYEDLLSNTPGELMRLAPFLENRIRPPRRSGRAVTLSVLQDICVLSSRRNGNSGRRLRIAAADIAFVPRRPNPVVGGTSFPNHAHIKSKPHGVLPCKSWATSSLYRSHGYENQSPIIAP